MPKKKQLPDYSRGMFGVTHQYFTRERADELKKKYGFKPEFDLLSELENATLYWQMLGHETDSSPSVYGRELETLLKRTQDLAESLAKLGDHATVAIYRADRANHANPRIDGQTLSSLKLTLRKLAWATRNATRNIPPVGPGRKQNDAQFALLLNLRAAYRLGTGRDDIVSRDDSYGKGYYGDFFEFLRECLRELKIMKSDSHYATLAQTAARFDARINERIALAGNGADDFDAAWDEAK